MHTLPAHSTGASRREHDGDDGDGDILTPSLVLVVAAGFRWREEGKRVLGRGEGLGLAMVGEYSEVVMDEDGRR